eukprot:1709845-Rhodomonas_salina.1
MVLGGEDSDDPGSTDAGLEQIEQDIMRYEMFLNTGAKVPPPTHTSSAGLFPPLPFVCCKFSVKPLTCYYNIPCLFTRTCQKRVHAVPCAEKSHLQQLPVHGRARSEEEEEEVVVVVEEEGGLPSGMKSDARSWTGIVSFSLCSVLSCPLLLPTVMPAVHCFHLLLAPPRPFPLLSVCSPPRRLLAQRAEKQAATGGGRGGEGGRQAGGGSATAKESREQL